MSSRTYLVLGPVQGAMALGDADAILTGETLYEQSGGAVAGVGDVDADGLDDVLIGAEFSHRGGEAAGVGYLVLGMLH